MVEQIYLTLELTAFVLCAHNVFGKKFRFKLLDIMGILVLVMSKSTINELGKSAELVWVVFVEVLIYCCLQFRAGITQLLSRYAITIIMVIMLQAVCSIIVIPLNSLIANNMDLQYLIINLIFFLAVLLGSQKINCDKLIVHYQRQTLKWKIVLLLLGVTAIAILQFICSRENIFSYKDGLIAVLFIIVFMVLYRWKETQFLYRQQEMERQFETMYDGAYQNLIKNVRMQQHDFKNHLQAMLGISEAGQSIEEICANQRQYCAEIMESFGETQILCKVNAKPLAAFLYNKIEEAQKEGIHTEHQLLVRDCNVGIPLYQVVEILGILLDNAYEATKQYAKAEQTVKLTLTEADTLHLKIANPTTLNSAEEFISYMEAGKSSKGEGRGYGLAKIAKYQKQYQLELKVLVEKYGDTNWLVLEMDIINPLA